MTYYIDDRDYSSVLYENNSYKRKLSRRLKEYK